MNTLEPSMILYDLLQFGDEQTIVGYLTHHRGRVGIDDYLSQRIIWANWELGVCRDILQES